MRQVFNCVIQGTVLGHPEDGHTNGSGRAYVKFRIVHRTGYRDSSGKWITTAPMTFEVTCWDEQLMLRARRFKPGNEVVVEVRKFVPYLDTSNDEAVMNINPANVLLVAPAAPSTGATGGRQRRGDLVVSPHGEKIAADAWPEAVTDLTMVHHR